MLWIAALLAAAVSACGPQETQTLSGRIGVTERSALAPPWPDGLAARIVESDAGGTITVPAGQTFAVALEGTPTAGYLWSAREVPDFLEAAGEARGPTHAAQRGPGFAGGNHWEILFFKATRPGTGALRLAQARPWESDEPPTKTFEVLIAAR